MSHPQFREMSTSTMSQQGRALWHPCADGYGHKHIGCTHQLKLPERTSDRKRGGEGGETATHGRQKNWEREPGCQIGKHLSSISVTTASLTASVAMTTEDCQASWREGWSKKSAAVTYFRREEKWSQCMCCLTAVSLHFNGGDAKQER